MRRSVASSTSVLVAAVATLGLQAPSFANGSVADLTSVTSTQVADILSGNGLTVDPATIEVLGNVQQFTQASAGEGFELAGPGLSLSSGYGNNLPSVLPNASATATQVAQLMQQTLTAAGYSGFDATVTNLSAIIFDIVGSSPSVQLNFLFLSAEGYMSNWDIAVFIVDGVNYAKLPNNRILRVAAESNLTNIGDQGLSLDPSVPFLNAQAAAPTQSITALLDPALTRHRAILAVGDTGDEVVPTYLLVGSPSASQSTVAGIAEAQLAPEEPVFTFPAFWLWTESTFQIDNKPGIIGQFTVDKDVTWSVLPSESSANFSVNSKGELLLTKALVGTSAMLAVEARDKDGNTFTRMVDVQVTPAR